MKIRMLNNDINDLILRVKKGEPAAQRHLYEWFSPKMLAVCRQYMTDIHHAEDALIQGFIKVFKNIHQYSGNGSFEGWVRRIMVNESISILRSKKRLEPMEDFNDYGSTMPSIESSLSVEEIQAMIDLLPEGGKLIFNLYVMEEYSHKEISEALGISESTSKSQLFHARKKLQSLIFQHNKVSYGG